MKLPTDSLGARLLGAFVLVAIAPLVIAGALVYRSGEATLREELGQRLGTVTQLRRQQIEAWLEGRKQDVSAPTALRAFKGSVARMAGSLWPAGPVVEELREVMEQTRISGGFSEMFLLDITAGRILVSTDPEQEGKIKRDWPYFREVRQGPFVQHVSHATGHGRAVLVFSAPVMGPGNAPIAILVGRADFRYLDGLMAERVGLGTTGRTVLVNRFNYVVSASLGGDQTDRGPVPSDGVKRALAGGSGTAVYQNHEGRTVVGAFRPLEQIGVALIAEMDADEAFAPIYRFRIGITLLIVLVCGAAAVIGIRLAWGISRPIQKLTRSHDERMAYSAALEAKVAERTRNLTALLQVTQALGSRLDLTETLRRAARSLTRVLGADGGLAYVLDAEGEAFQAVAGYHVPPAVRASGGSPLSIADHPFVAHASVHRQAVFAENVAADQRLDAAWVEPWGFRSALFVPMFCGGRLVGGLFTGWQATRPPLSEEEMDLIDGIGRQAGMAVQTAALFADSEHRRRTAETLAELDAVLARSLDPGVVAEGILRGMHALLDSPFSGVYRLDPRSGDLVSLAVEGENDEMPLVLPRGTGICGLAVDRRDVIASPDVLADPEIRLTPELRDRVERGEYHAMLAAPLRIGERVIGALCLSDQRGRVFTAEEARLLRSFASQAALALENARHYDEARARATRMTRLSEVGRVITSSLDLREVLDRVAGAARDLLDGDLARVWVADNEAGVVRLMASQDRAGSGLPGTTELAPGVGVIGRVMAERRPYYTPDLRAEELESSDDWLRQDGYTSRLALPLIVGDRALGALTVATKARREFSREDHELLELFASQAATAVENARLFANAEAQATALAKKNAELDAFSYSVSHDLKSPLIAIQAMCGLVMEDYGERLDDDGRRALGRIEANAAYMARLIADLLALARIGREAQTPEPVPVREVVDTVLESLSEQIQARGVEVVCTADVTVWATRVHLEQILGNLISNAIKYLGPTPAPRVEVGAEADSRAVQFWVRDNGIGIDPAYQTRIFEVFQRLRAVEVEGTGVGLAIVKKIVDTAGGRIWVESTPGQGATFRFTWPARASTQAA